MKALKILSKIFFVLSICLICVGNILNLDIGVTAYFAILTALLGIFLRYAKGDVQTKIGNALYIFSCVFLLVVVFKVTFLLGTVFVLAGIGFASFGYFVDFLIYVKSSKTAKILNPEIDPKILALKAWKQYVKEGFVTEEEYEEKRKEILNLND